MDDREIELKLALAPDDMARLRRHSCLEADRQGEPSSKRLVSIYFDTPDFSLAAAGISLRLRRVGDGHIQTIKTAGTAISGLFDRDEWEIPVATEALDHDHLRATGLAIFGDGALIEQLRPAFATEIDRTIYRLAGPDWEVEAAFDQGRVVVAERSEEICELELELVRGRPRHLFALARRVADSVAVRPLSRSKAERGFRLATGAGDAPVKGKAPPLDRDMSVAGAFQTIARACLDHLLVNERCLLATGDGEAIHQMRVALRRLRSAIKLFRPILRRHPGKAEAPSTSELDEVKTNLRWLLERLGPARDADVFLAEIIDPVVAVHPDDDGLEALRRHWAAERDAKLAAAIDAVRGQRFTALVLHLGQWVESGDWLGPESQPPGRRLAQPIAPFASQRLGKAMARLLRVAGDDFRRLSHEELHAVRIQGKQVRYAGEFFAPLVPRKQMKVFLAELAELQDALGQLNDIAVAGPKLNGRNVEGGRARAAGLVSGWHQSRRGALLAQAEKAFKRWRNCPLPWTE